MVNTIYHYVILSYSHSICVLRTYGFLIMLGIVILLGYFLVPPEHAGYQTMYVGEMRSIYNSAWLGAVATLSISLFLWPFGFFLLRNKISEDRQSSMGSIIFASQASKVRYLFSKMMGHFLTLAVMAGVLELAFIAMQYVRGEESQLVVSDYLFPYLWIALPSLFVLAALIILFDAISIFRGIIGIILFFSLWTALSAISFSGLGTLDVFGAHFIFTEVSQDIKAMFPHVGSIHMNFGYQTAQNLTIFKWEGVTWTIENILSRLLWLLLGAFLFLISVLAFRRTTLLSMQDSTTTPQTGSEFIREDREENRKLHLRPIEKAGHYSFSSIFRSEWRLMIKEVPVWWLGIGSVLFLLTVVVPFSYTKIFLTLPWLWVIPYLASAGARERMYRTEPFVLSNGSPFRQLFAIWLSGICFTFLITSGGTIHMIIANDWGWLTAWLAAVLFTPTLALASGIWSGTRKLFETIYVFWWIMGPVQDAPYLDFIGIHHHDTSIYLILAMVLILMAVIRRKRQVYH